MFVFIFPILKKNLAKKYLKKKKRDKKSLVKFFFSKEKEKPPGTSRPSHVLFLLGAPTRIILEADVAIIDSSTHHCLLQKTAGFSSLGLWKFCGENENLRSSLLGG